MFVVQVTAATGSYPSAGALEHGIVLLLRIPQPRMKASVIQCHLLQSSRQKPMFQINGSDCKRTK